MERISYRLSDPQRAHQALAEVWAAIKPWLIAGHALALDVRQETRSTAQNRLLWSCLSDLARQVDWHGQKLDAESWKDMCSAALKRQRVVPGIEGGFVVLGQRTSKMTRAEMTEMIDFVHAFGAQHGVTWARTSLGRDCPDDFTPVQP